MVIRGNLALVVGGTPPEQVLACSLLARAALRAEITDSPAEALRAAMGRPVRLILLDDRVAGDDPAAVARRLQGTGARLVVALEGPEALTRWTEVPVDGILDKPFDTRGFVIRVRTWLRRRPAS